MANIGFWATAGAGGGAAGAYELISTAYGTGSSGQITFASIPSTFKHLQLRIVYDANVSGTTARLRFNSDSNSNYARHYLAGDGGAVESQGAGSLTSIEGQYGEAGYFSAGIYDILDYASTSKNKTVRSLSGTTGGTKQVRLASGLWVSTSAVTSIEIIPATASYAYNTASRFSLYGIKGA